MPKGKEKLHIDPLPKEEALQVEREMVAALATLHTGDLAGIVLCATNTKGECNSTIIGSAQLIEIMLGMACEHVAGKFLGDGTVPDGMEN